jgi:hypothetical protein
MRVHIPSVLRKWTGGRDVVDLQIAATSCMTATEVIDTVARQFPGFATVSLMNKASFAAT